MARFTAAEESPPTGTQLRLVALCDLIGLPDRLVRLLALSTAGDPASVALLTQGGTLGRELPSGAVFEQLVPTAQELLSEAGFTVAELEGVAVARGPGSFTGLRVGAAAALGLCRALDLPLFSASTLEVWAALAFADRRLTRCHVALDAKRGELYVATLAANTAADGPHPSCGTIPQLTAGPRVLGVAEALTYVTASAGPAEGVPEAPVIAVCGDGRGVLVRAGLDPRRPGFDRPPEPLAGGLARLVALDPGRYRSSAEAFTLDYHRDPRAVTARTPAARCSGP